MDVEEMTRHQTPSTREIPNPKPEKCRAHVGTTSGARLCPKDQPQQVRMPKVAELSQIAWPRRVAATGAPHTAAVRFRELLVVVSRCAQNCNSLRRGLGFGAWNFFGAWSLGFGVLCVTALTLTG